MGEEYAYIIEAFKKILQSRHKVQEALCYMILPRYEDFAKDYKIFKKYKDCRDFEECLASLFGIEYAKMKTIIKKLNDYKNEKDSISRCMAIKISL